MILLHTQVRTTALNDSFITTLSSNVHPLPLHPPSQLTLPPNLLREAIGRECPLTSATSTLLPASGPKCVAFSLLRTLDGCFVPWFLYWIPSRMPQGHCSGSFLSSTSPVLTLHWLFLISIQTMVIFPI